MTEFAKIKAYMNHEYVLLTKEEVREAKNMLINKCGFTPVQVKEKCSNQFFIK